MSDLVNKCPQASRAFNIIKLLVVVAISGILAALIIPLMSQSKRKAHQMQCVNNLQQLVLAQQMFVDDNSAYPAYVGATNSDNPGTWMLQLERGGFFRSKPKRGFMTEGV